MKEKFSLGKIVITTPAFHRLTEEDVVTGMERHSQGDWGNVSTADAQANNLALKSGERLLSSYWSGKERFWIITEADRSLTTVLLPEDY